MAMKVWSPDAVELMNRLESELWERIRHTSVAIADNSSHARVEDFDVFRAAEEAYQFMERTERAAYALSGEFMAAKPSDLPDEMQAHIADLAAIEQMRQSLGQINSIACDLDNDALHVSSRQEISELCAVGLAAAAARD